MAIFDAGGALLQLVDTVRGLGDNYYKASAAWREFPGKVLTLRAKHEALRASFDNYGLLESLEPSVLGLLENANRLLQEEEDRLQARNAREKQKGCTGKFNLQTCFGRVGEMLFPEKVGAAIQTAIGAYDSIDTYFAVKRANDETARSEMKSMPHSLSFQDHGQKFYVPLPCEEKVYSALKESGDEHPTVVLLYGGPGKGKTTVVRHICLSCQRDKSLFDQVVLLECGIAADQQDKEIRLLQKLGWDEARDMSQKSDQDVRTQRLQNLLKHRKLLVVLDDLCEPGLLLRLLNLSGPGVKFLVSSQQKEICETLGLGCQSKSFEVDDVEESVAKQILAAHAGSASLDNVYLQEIIRKIINQAERIPLVLATLGARIRSVGEEADDLEVWRCLLEKLVHYLDFQSSKPILGSFGHTYPKTYWSALKQSIDGLNSEEKHLFFLICICKGPSVLQDILQFFCTVTVQSCDRMAFLSWKDKLKSSHLVFEKDKKMLSIHSLTKRLVDEYMLEDQKSALHALVEKRLSLLPNDFESRDQNTSVIIALVSLYIKRGFGETLAPKVGLTPVLLL